MKVITEDPEKVKAENIKIKEKYDKLLQDQHQNKNNINSITKEKTLLEETLKNNTLHIDHLNKKLEENTTHYENIVNELKKQVATKEDKIEEANKQYKQLLLDNKEEIKQLTAYTIKLTEEISKYKDVINTKNNYIKDLKNLNPIDRLLKNYPEEEPEEVKLLPLNTH